LTELALIIRAVSCRLALPSMSQFLAWRAVSVVGTWSSSGGGGTYRCRQSYLLPWSTRLACVRFIPPEPSVCS